MIYSGTGSPEGTQVGSVGDWYFRADASAVNPPLYSKMSGTETNTGWIPMISAAAAAALVPEVPMWVGGTGELTITGNQPTVTIT